MVIFLNFFKKRSQNLIKVYQFILIQLICETFLVSQLEIYIFELNKNLKIVFYLLILN